MKFKICNIQLIVKIDLKQRSLNTKSDNVWQDISKSDIIYFDKKNRKYFNDFQNWNFSVL